ncbi:hypothetical protein DL93DRAFT_1269047 [Clavulina sp. PMI_390]|nr:hypothetical protein DL93DRAFT_1269047 [Clavulina sp. PMI_390]
MADDRAQPPSTLIVSTSIHQALTSRLVNPSYLTLGSTASPLSQTSLHLFTPSDGHHRRSIVIETPRSPVRRRESAFSQQPMSPTRRAHPAHRRSMSPTRPRSMSIALGIKRDNSMLPELPRPTLVQGLRSLVNASWFNILLVFVPISWSFEYALRPRTSAHQAAIFISTIHSPSPYPILIWIVG